MVFDSGEADGVGLENAERPPPPLQDPLPP